MPVSTPTGPVSATTSAVFTVDNRVANQIEAIEIDLCRYFAASIRRLDGTANFLFGTEAAATEGRIPLVPGREVPDVPSLGMVAASERPAEDNFRQTRLDVVVTFRGKEDRTGSDTDPSGQEIAYASAKALQDYLHRIEGDLTNVFLPSERRDLAFNEVNKQSLGEDDEKRYMVVVQFVLNLSGDDIQ